jgi:hypothetical protein
MSRDRIKDWLEGLGMAAIIGSLIFVGLQVRQDQNIAIADTYGTVSDSSLQLAELVKGQGDLWRRGLDGAELSQDEQIEFNTIATSVESWFLMQWYRSRMLGVSNPQTDLRDYSYAVYQHVGLRRHFEAKIDRIVATDTAFGVPVEHSEWSTGVSEYLQRLTENSVPLPETKSYVFWH